MASLRSALGFRANRLKIVRLILFLVVVLLFYFIWRRSLRRHSLQYSTALAVSSCPPCDCDCLEEPIIDLPFDCDKDDPETNAELKKDMVALLSEEIILQKNVTDHNLEHAEALITGAKRTSLHYQREAEKCNAGVQACEESRERAQAALVEERKLTTLWMNRARESGWDNDDSTQK